MHDGSFELKDKKIATVNKSLDFINDILSSIYDLLRKDRRMTAAIMHKFYYGYMRQSRNCSN